VTKIIVDVDESDHSKDAVALAARLAHGSDVELLLVCAYPYDTTPSRAANSGYKRYLHEDALAVVDRLAETLPAAGRLERRAVPDVSPARAIQEIAARERASLIVIGSSRRGGIGRVLAGTTAERLLHGAPCPVAVAPRDFHAHGPGDIGTITVGYDGTVEAKAALVGARTIAAHAAPVCGSSRSSMRCGSEPRP